MLKQRILHYVKLVLPAVIVLAMSISFYSYLHVPQVRKAQELRHQLDRQEQSLHRARQVAQADPQTRRRLEEIAREMRDLSLRFPTVRPDATIFIHLDESSARAGVTLEALTYLQRTQEGEYERIPMEVLARGPYASQLKFLSLLEEMPLVAGIEKVALGPVPVRVEVKEPAPEESFLASGTTRGRFVIAVYIAPEREPKEQDKEQDARQDEKPTGGQ